MVENSLSNVKSSVKRKPGPRSFKPFKLSPEDISAFLKSAINKIEDYFYLVDMNGRVLYANDSACRGLGYSLEEIITMKVSNFDPNYPKIVWGKFIEEVRSSGSFKVQSLHINKSGVAFPVSITGVYLKYKNAEYMFAFVNDITEINRIKESLTEAVRMYNLLAANMSDSVLILDTKLQPVYMSPSAINERGYTLEEYKNLPLQEKYSADSMKRVWDVWSHMKSMSPSSSASQLMRQNLEVECYRKDGTSYWSDNQVTLLRDESGDVTGLLVVGRNITEKKLNEQRIFDLNQALNRRVFELEASNKELEAFAYSVSHDMTAPLRSINGFSQALLEDYDNVLDERGSSYLRRIKSASERMSKQIDDMLMLSRIIRSEMQIEKVDLSAIALNFASELKQGQPQRKVEFVIQEGIIVEGDRNLLEEVILNLMRNAWKFSSKHDTALIEVGSVDILGENVYFVKDDGAGFDMKYAEKLFMPFRRMHSEAEFPGNGIGLATVQRIIRRHGGRIWAESAVEKGTAIYFTVGLAMCEGK